MSSHFKKFTQASPASTSRQPDMREHPRHAWQIVLWLSLIALLLFTLASLVSYNPADPAWRESSSDAQTVLYNLGGQAGAFVSDILLSLLGYSAWLSLLMMATIVVWSYHSITQTTVHRRPLWWLMLGFICLLAGATMFEALHWGQSAYLPNGAGGDLGQELAARFTALIGRIGAGLTAIFAIGVGLVMLLNLSFLDALEWLGALIEKVMHIVASQWQAWQTKRANQREARLARETLMPSFSTPAPKTHEDPTTEEVSHLTENTKGSPENEEVLLANSPTRPIASTQSQPQSTYPLGVVFRTIEQAVKPKATIETAVKTEPSLGVSTLNMIATPQITAEPTVSLPTQAWAAASTETVTTLEDTGFDANKFNSNPIHASRVTDPLVEIPKQNTSNFSLVDDFNTRAHDFAVPEFSADRFHNDTDNTKDLSVNINPTELKPLPTPSAQTTEHAWLGQASTGLNPLPTPPSQTPLTSTTALSNEWMELDDEWSTQPSASPAWTMSPATPPSAMSGGIPPTQPVELSSLVRVGSDPNFPPPVLFTHNPLPMALQPLPPLSLLSPAPPTQEQLSQESLMATAQLIEQRLQEYGVQVKVTGMLPGPVITRYEIEPATGVKGSQVMNLTKDLARALSMVSIRVVETIPGKSCMGMELPNPKRQIVRLTEILSDDSYQQNTSKIILVLGKDIEGKPVVADLAKMPHALVAGTTGSGKSVAINAMILSILYKATAAEVRMIMIDPKMLELSIYEGIPHLLAPVVTDMKHAANALNWCVGEMERRYRLLSKLGVRNLAGYNEKISHAAAQGQKIPNPFSLTPNDPEPLDNLPLIVVIVDELADLMMVAGKKIEELIARLAQKARAAGIHLILATQRPSVDVITGLIKANVPTRISFQVSSKIDSRTILDAQGAEALLGQGDMLFQPAGTGYPQRAHGAFVGDDEVHRVVEFLKAHGEPNYIEGILEGGTTENAGNDDAGSGVSNDAESDALYDQAVDFMVRTRKASTSSLQRQFRIGFNRAARLIDQMEAAGIVSPMQHNGNREVLAPPMRDD